MAGLLPTTKREFNVQGVGKIVLHRLPAQDEFEARKIFSNQDGNVDIEMLEKVAEKNVYYMLHGKFDAKQAPKLKKLMDTNQLAMIHTTGLFFTNLEQDNLEDMEKNSESNLN